MSEIMNKALKEIKAEKMTKELKEIREHLNKEIEKKRNEKDKVGLRMGEKIIIMGKIEGLTQVRDWINKKYLGE